MLSRFFSRLLRLFLIVSLFSSPLFAADPSEENIRGVEQQETKPLDATRAALSGVLYGPRKVVDGSLYAAGKTAETLSDEDFIKKVKDILYLYDRKLLWYPLFGYASEFRPNYGIGLYYKEDGLRSHFRASLHDAHYWSLSWKNSYLHDLSWASWKNSILGVLETKNDRRFYGIGAHPKSDPRNTFIAHHDYGTFTEDRRKIQWSSALENPDGKYGAQYLGYVQRRDFKSHGLGSNDLEDIFDVSRIPGFQHPVNQIYNELSLTYDTRKNKKMLAPGFRAEVFGGFSNGLGKNESDLFRTGFDTAGFIPVVKKDRLIVPRLVFDSVENLDNTPIPFSEYPRHPTFRGVSNREWLRSERVTMVPSLEYQWPISHIFSGHIFFDSLIVGPRLSEFNWHHGLWSAGIGVNLHYLEHEIGRMELAAGSEGFYFAFTIGEPLRTSHRADW